MGKNEKALLFFLGNHSEELIRKYTNVSEALRTHGAGHPSVVLWLFQSVATDNFRNQLQS